MSISPSVLASSIGSIAFDLTAEAALGLKVKAVKRYASTKANPTNTPEAEVKGELVLQPSLNYSATGGAIISLKVETSIPLPEINLGMMKGTIKAGELFPTE